MFVAPNWFTGTIIWACFFIPFILAIIFAIYNGIGLFNTNNSEINDKYMKRFIVSIILVLVLLPVCHGLGGYIWHETYEIPSINEKVVTVQDWQVKPDSAHSSDGIMTIDNANQLMLITSDGEAFVNEENFLFQKFDTRDVLNTLKVGGKYKIQYYGWREGYNSGFPNILSVEEVIDESNATNVSLSNYFGNKLTLQ